MKTYNYILFFGAMLLASCTTSSQMQSGKPVDDVYFSSADRNTVEPPVDNKVQQQQSEQSVTQPQDNQVRSDNYDTEQTPVYQSDTQSATDENGTTYITNNYYGGTSYAYDYDDYYYSRSLRRWYEPNYGFGYYSNYYVDPFWYNPYYNSGFSFSISFGYPFWGYRRGCYSPWGYPYSGCSIFNYYQPYYYSYGPGYYPYWGSSYWRGYYNGYNNGYYNGYYGSYYGDYNSSAYYYGNNSYYGSGSYYGARSSGSSNTPSGGDFLNGGRTTNQINPGNDQQMSNPGINSKPVNDNYISNEKIEQKGNIQSGKPGIPQTEINKKFDNIQSVPSNPDKNSQTKEYDKDVQLNNSAPIISKPQTTTPKNNYPNPQPNNKAPNNVSPNYNKVPKVESPKYNQNQIPQQTNPAPKQYNQPRMNNTAPKNESPKYNQNHQFNTIPKTETPKYNNQQQMNSSPRQYNQPAPKMYEAPKQNSAPMPRNFSESNQWNSSAPSMRSNPGINFSSPKTPAGGEKQEIKSYSKLPR